jgi:hypothetical protein
VVGIVVSCRVAAWSGTPRGEEAAPPVGWSASRAARSVMREPRQAPRRHAAAASGTSCSHARSARYLPARMPRAWWPRERSGSDVARSRFIGACGRGLVNAVRSAKAWRQLVRRRAHSAARPGPPHLAHRLLVFGEMASAHGNPGSRATRTAGRRWSQAVTERSDALDLERNVFRKRSPRAIAESLRRSAERSRRRKAEPFRSAMSMLTFYINRAGRSLPATRRRVLERAKAELRRLYHRA